MRRIGPWLLALGIILAPLQFWHGGAIDIEATGFVRNYWAGRPLLATVFHPGANDFENYQAREASYAIDFLDAQWLRFALSRGFVLLVPPSGLVAALAVALVVVLGARRSLPRLDSATVFAVLLLYLTSYSLASTNAILYRATKPLIAPLLLASLLFALHLWRDESGSRRHAYAFVGMGALCLVMGLLDPQGAFQSFVLAGLLGLVFLFRHRLLGAFLGATAASLSLIAYDLWIGPSLIHSLNGYWPSFAYQHLQNPENLLTLQPWIVALGLLVDWTGLLVGTWPRVVTIAGLLAVAGACTVLLVRRPDFRPSPLLLSLAAAASAGELFMVATMVVRHGAISGPDHRAWYYPLPFQAGVLFIMLVLLERWAASRGGPLPRWVVVVGWVLAASNLAHWPAERQAMESGPWARETATQSERLKWSLRTATTHPLLAGHHRRLFVECVNRLPRYRDLAEPTVIEGAGFDPAYERDGRLFAWVDAHSSVTLVSSLPGPYVLEGELWARPGQRVELRLASGTVLGTVDGVKARVVRFAFPLELRNPRTVGEFTLEPESTERFGIYLPITLRWRSAADAPSGATH